MEAVERKSHALELFAGLPERYDLLASLLSFGQDPRWRRAMVGAVRAGPGDRVLDVATGTGMVACELATRYGCAVVGLDQSEQHARARAREARGATRSSAQRIDLVLGEAERLPFEDGEFDALTFTYLLRYVDDPAATMRELARVVKPGGTIASLEFGVPRSRVAARAVDRSTRGSGFPRSAGWPRGPPAAPASRARSGRSIRGRLPALGRLVSRDWYDVGPLPRAEHLGLLSALSAGRRRGALEASRASASVETRGMSLGGGVVMWGVREDGGVTAA